MNEEGFITPSEVRMHLGLQPLHEIKDAKMIPAAKLTKERIALIFQVPYWLIEGAKPSWLRRPVWRMRAWWWTHRWDRTTYDGSKFKNGIAWWRFTSGPFVDWGLWIWDTGACESLHVTEPDEPRMWVGDFYGHEIWILKPHKQSETS